MAKLCVISVAALSKRVADLSPANGALRRLANGAPRLIKPTVPAVTCVMQATVTTGVPPSRHGILSNGFYFRKLGRVSFWEQSNKMLDVPRFWRAAKGPTPGAPPRGPKLKTAMLFWQNSMFGAADIVVTPKPIHTADGQTLSACYSDPPWLYDELTAKLGPFELKHYWGPFASLPASQWIAQSAIHVWQVHQPDLQLVYLPHLDYSLQKVGPSHPTIAAEVAAVDQLVGQVAGAVQADGGRVIVMGDYGMVPVRRAVLPNVAFRQAGLLRVRSIGGAEMIEIGELHAFAMVDHQVAFVYCCGDEARRKAKKLLLGMDGVADVIDLTESDPLNMRHLRGPELVALAQPDAWFAYYWWTDPAVAPAFARTVDIHRKPGYDPCELFIDPATRAISMNPAMVKGSHGVLPSDPDDLPVLLSRDGLATKEPIVPAAAVAGVLASAAGL